MVNVIAFNKCRCNVGFKCVMHVLNNCRQAKSPLLLLVQIINLCLVFKVYHLKINMFLMIALKSHLQITTQLRREFSWHYILMAKTTADTVRSSQITIPRQFRGYQFYCRYNLINCGLNASLLGILWVKLTLLELFLWKVYFLIYFFTSCYPRLRPCCANNSLIKTLFSQLQTQQELGAAVLKWCVKIGTFGCWFLFLEISPNCIRVE